MDASSLQLQQEILASQSLDSMFRCTNAQSQEQQQEKKPRPPEQALKCPRCDSTNTKFCYYNNYSLSQPRYFCKSCRRYWTKGGTLRNFPVGGGCRKNKRSSSSSRRTTPDFHQPHHITATTLNTPSISSLISPLSSYDHHDKPSATDLTLAFARLHGQAAGFMMFDSHANQESIPLLAGNLNNSHFDFFGNCLLESKGNVGVQHLYCGLGGNGNLGDLVSSYEEHHHQMGMQYDPCHSSNQEMMSNPSSGASTPTTIKQELSENRVLLGLPWQLSSSEGNYINGGESWNSGILGSSLNSLLNSPLV